MIAIDRLRACLLAVVGLLAWSRPAHAGDRDTSVVNTSGPDGAPVAARLRGILDSRELLARQSEKVTAALENQPVKRPDFENVRKAFADFRYQEAERLLADLTDDLLASRAEIAHALAEVLWWRGLVAAVDDREQPTEQRTKSLRYFAAAYRLDPDLVGDASVTSPRVRLLIDEAKRKRLAPGRLVIDPDVDDAELALDGGAPSPLRDAVEVPAGLHLLRVSAPERTTVLRLVEVVAGSSVHLGVELPSEGTADRVRRLVGEAASAPEGRARLPALERLGDVLGVQRLLVVESLASRRAKIRLYDVGGGRMSQQFSFANSDSAATVESSVDRALRMSDDDGGGGGRARVWYRRWPVWAAVGGVVVSGVVVALVVSNRRDPRVQGL